MIVLAKSCSSSLLWREVHTYKEIKHLIGLRIYPSLHDLDLECMTIAFAAFLATNELLITVDVGARPTGSIGDKKSSFAKGD